MSRPITPPGVHPQVDLHRDGELIAERDALTAPGDRFASGLELAAIAIDAAGRPLLARAPRAWQRRLIDRAHRRAVAHPRALRTVSAAATVLLDVFEGARDAGLRRPALDAYLDLLARTSSPRLHDSMTMNLDRVRARLDGPARAALAAARAQMMPPSPPYAAWFPDGAGTLRVLCQVQDVFFASWRHFFRKLGFRSDGRATGRRIRYVREDARTRIEVDYVDKAQGLFSAMADPKIDVVMFLGHSDWWARVPRNLAIAPDQVGEKMLVVIMCFGKHFYHSLHARYPRAHIVTTKDPTEDPEDVAMLRHVFDGISARRSWTAIHRAAAADPRTEGNFIYPDDARYVVGVSDEDRDGRLDRFDRFCNLAPARALPRASLEAGFVADPPGLHPRGAELDPRELDGGPVLEAALMMNSLSYDNFWLDLVNQDQRVVAGGWHRAGPDDFTCARFTDAHVDGKRIVRMTCSNRYVRASQPALTAMCVYEGWCWWAARVPRAHRPSPRDTALMGILLVAHALGNADYPRPDEVLHAFLRRRGFPAGIPFKLAYQLVELDEDWESGSPKSVAKFASSLPPGVLDRLEALLEA